MGVDVHADKSIEFNVFNLKEKAKSIPEIELLMKDREQRKFKVWYESVKNKVFLNQEDKRWFEASIKIESVLYPAKVRVRGDVISKHVAGEKKSWRIKLKKDHYIKGMNAFNLIIPDDKGAGEMLMSFIARKCGLMTPRNRFVQMSFNHKTLGLYWEVEHFNKDFIAYQRRTETALIGSIDHWTSGSGINAGIDSINYEEFWIDGYTKNYLHANKYTDLAWKAFKNFSNELYSDSRASQLTKWLDLEAYYKLNLLTILSGSMHTELGFHNCKLYFNAEKGIMEPVPWDYLVSPIVKWGNSLDVGFNLSLLRKKMVLDDRQHHSRNKFLYQLMGALKLEQTLKYDFYKEKGIGVDGLSRTTLGREVLMRLNSATEIILNNHAYVKKVLSHNSLSIRLEKAGDDTIKCNLVPDMYSGVVLSAIRSGKASLQSMTTMDGKPVNLNSSVFHCGRQILNTVQRPPALKNPFNYMAVVPVKKVYTLTCKFDRPVELEDLEFEFKNAVTGNVISGDKLYSKTAPESSVWIKKDESFSDWASRNPGVNWIKEENKIIIPRGIYEIEKDLVFPEVNKIEIQEGSVFILAKSISILSPSPIHAVGSEELKIKFIPAVPSDPFGTIAILHQYPEQISVFKHVIFRGGHSSVLNFSNFSGMVAIYYGKLVMEKCDFVDARGEDGLNLKYVDFKIKQCHFNKNASDGLDVDFGKGIIEASSFGHHGGDGLDFSGSTTHVSNSIFRYNADKGISVGENSRISSQQNQISLNHIGIAIKDGSHLKSLGDFVFENKFGFASYIKKPSYGPSRGSVVNVVFLSNIKDVEIKNRCQLELKKMERQPASRGELLMMLKKEKTKMDLE